MPLLSLSNIHPECFSALSSARSSICFGFCALLVGIAVAIIIGIILIGILLWKLFSGEDEVSRSGYTPRYSKYEARREERMRKLPILRKASEEERKEKTSGANHCPDCGEKLNGEPNYCPNCGYELMEEEDEAG